MRPVAVIGIGKTPFGAFPDQDLRTLAVQASEKALKNANVTPDQVEAFHVEGFHLIRGNVCVFEGFFGSLDRQRAQILVGKCAEWSLADADYSDRSHIPSSSYRGCWDLGNFACAAIDEDLFGGGGW